MIATDWNTNVRCYKVTSQDENFWSIVAADDEYLAKEFFLDEYKLKEKKFNKEYKMEKLSFDFKIKSPFFSTLISLGELIGEITSTPRVLSDSVEYMDYDYSLVSGYYHEG